MPRADWNQMKKYPVLIANNALQSQFERQIMAMTDNITA